MPYIANTPESVLPRADSLNPAATCRGLTANGRPCRRGLASSTRSSPSSSPSKGVVAVLEPGGTDAAAFYCWQHKDQAQQFFSSTAQGRRTGNLRPKQRSSIDTLVDRLGLLEVDEAAKTKKGRDNRTGGPASRRQDGSSSSQPRTICCFLIVDDDDLPATRPSQKPVDTRPARNPHSTVPHGVRASQGPAVIRKANSSLRPSTGHQKPTPSTPNRPSTAQPSSRQSLSPYHTPMRPSLQGTPGSSSSHTQSLLSIIPATLSPQTTSLLLAELAKPISEADDEGYIYMFWVTPTTSSTTAPPPPEIASSLLPSPNRPNNGRRTSDAIRAAQNLTAPAQGSNGHSGTIRLKIGRTSNVQRRLNEWSRQCSHNLTLIRYYPYSPSSSSSPSPSPARSGRSGQGTSPAPAPGRKVPHVHRVERLIHIELAERRLRGLGPCEDCGKEHREWFEVEAKKEALRLVDECVRRWVGWGERQG